jgi:large subunit ribosomal protein L21
MYAIFENGSHQYRVSEGDLVTVDRHPGDHGEELVFDKVLLVATEAGATIGTPVVAGAKVVGRIIRQFRDRKIIIQKFRRRKNMRRKRGHRQYYTTVKILKVSVA